jgi:hypothetical protein
MIHDRITHEERRSRHCTAFRNPQAGVFLRNAVELCADGSRLAATLSNLGVALHTRASKASEGKQSVGMDLQLEASATAAARAAPSVGSQRGPTSGTPQATGSNDDR